MRRIFGLLPLPALFLGGLLANSLPAQDAASLAPEGTFLALRVASMERLSQIVGQLMPGAEEGEDPVAEMLGMFHSLEGVDRAKPVFVFMTVGADDPLPWFALPVQEAAKFKEGMRLPGEPIMKAGYALLSPALVEGAAPKLGVPGIGVPEGDLGMRLMVGTLLGSLDPNQLTQFKFQIGFVLSMGFGQSPAINRTLDQALALAGKIRALDLAITCGTQMSLTLTLSGAPDSELAKLGSLVKAGPLHPEFGPFDPMLWIWSGMELAADAPKLLTDLLDGIQKLSASDEEKDNPFGMGTGMLLGTLPSGALLGAASREVLDTGTVGKAIATKEGLFGLLKDMLPLIGNEFFDEDDSEIALADFSFKTSAFSVDGRPVHSLTMKIPHDEDLGETARDARNKLFPGGNLGLWTGLLGKQMILVMGPEDAARRIFASAAKGVASLPGFAKGAVMAGQVKAGHLMRFIMSMADDQPKEAQETLKDLPETQFRFTLIPSGASMTARLTVRMDDLVALIKAATAFSGLGFDDDDDWDDDDWEE